MKDFFIKLIGKINFEWLFELIFGRYFFLTPEDHEQILKVLSKGNYIILTRRLAHASTYASNFAHLFLTGRFGYYSHACMNIDPHENESIDSVRVLESVGSGVKLSQFMEVFNCDAVCILQPKMPAGCDWPEISSKGLSRIGSEYDTGFNLKDWTKFSCVEIVLYCLSFIPDYKVKFHGLLAMIELERNLTPDMYLECGSFEKVLEIKRSF